MALIFYKQNLNERRQFKCKTMILKWFVHILAGESGFKLETRSGAVLCYEWRRIPKQRRFCHKFSHQRLRYTKIASSSTVEVTERRERVSIFIQINRSRNFWSYSLRVFVLETPFRDRPISPILVLEIKLFSSFLTFTRPNFFPAPSSCPWVSEDGSKLKLKRLLRKPL